MTDALRVSESLRSLIYETPCSSLSAVDRAILIERELGDVFEVVGSEDLQSQLEAQETENEELLEEIGECRDTMKALVEAIEGLQLWTEGEQATVAKVGALIVTDTDQRLQGSTRHVLSEAIAAAKLEIKKIVG